MNKRYLLFAYNDYYPTGGMYGCKLKTDDWNEIEKAIIKLAAEYDNIQYYDSEIDDFFDWDGEKWTIKSEYYNY